MGIPDTILYQDEEEALRLFEIGSMCEPGREEESVAMANILIESAPLVIGITDTEERQELVKYVYKISRALIGNDLADQLHYPSCSTLGVLPWFWFRTRCQYTLEKLLPGVAQARSSDRFAALLDAAAFDDDGISYRMPDHLHASKSSWW